MGTNTTPTSNRRGRIGRRGEQIAADHCVGLGWTLLDRNWRNRYGELDIIATDGTTLIVVEVKTRATSTFGEASYAVTPTKLNRIAALTRMWLAAQERYWPAVRIDVIAVHLDRAAPDGTQVEIRHHRGVSE